MVAQKTTITLESTLKIVRYVIANIVLMCVIGYLTIDVGANFHSRFAASILSLLLPYFIVLKTKKMGGVERLLKFGFGLGVYLIASIVVIGIPVATQLGILPCLLLAMLVLWKGDSIELLKDK